MPFMGVISPSTTRRGPPCIYQSSKGQWFFSATHVKPSKGDEFLRLKKTTDVWLEVRINGWDCWAVDVYPRNKA